MADNKKRMSKNKPKTLNYAQEISKEKGESWATINTICDEEEQSMTPEISIPKSDFGVHKKSIMKRIWNGLKNVFSFQHNYEPFKEEMIRGIKDPMDEEESSWCHDSSRSVRDPEERS
ncbi:uncharacterized protein LOC143257909 [Tachypleus tridentatus]|uniref:uncharacterized protein LOC143257909 n=1 Tax=Tachypleus tridentatus TaxID=6853 RepID=UPI003FD3399B